MSEMISGATISVSKATGANFIEVCIGEIFYG